jgi:hypothetical protein
MDSFGVSQHGQHGQHHSRLKSHKYQVLLSVVVMLHLQLVVTMLHLLHLPQKLMLLHL